jgi:hypothetical protein
MTGDHVGDVVPADSPSQKSVASDFVQFQTDLLGDDEDFPSQNSVASDLLGDADFGPPSADEPEEFSSVPREFIFGEGN